MTNNRYQDAAISGLLSVGLEYLFKTVRKLFRVLNHIVHQSVTRLIFKCNGVQIGKFRTNGIPIIDKSGDGSRISIGFNLSMNNSTVSNQIGYNHPCTFIVQNGAHLQIGNNVGISQTIVVALANVNIGDNVKIGGGVKIYTTDFHSLNYLARRCSDDDKKERISKAVTIEDDVFVGAGTIILKGVTIGSRSIIGAGSIVTKDIPSDEMWAGNPAKFIRKV